MHYLTLIQFTLKCRRYVGILVNADECFFQTFEDKSLFWEEDVSILFMVFNYLASLLAKKIIT